jgi:ATP-dependent DNA ligase
MRFYKPMLAKSVSKPFSGMDWIFEIKWDGFRAIALTFITSRKVLEAEGFA